MCNLKKIKKTGSKAWVSASRPAQCASDSCVRTGTRAGAWSHLDSPVVDPGWSSRSFGLTNCTGNSEASLGHHQARGQVVINQRFSTLPVH